MIYSSTNLWIKLIEPNMNVHLFLAADILQIFTFYQNHQKRNFIDQGGLIDWKTKHHNHIYSKSCVQNQAQSWPN